MGSIPANAEKTRKGAPRRAMPVIGQAKQFVGGANDPEEREADQMAALVMRAMRSPVDFGNAEAPSRIRRSTRLTVEGGEPADDRSPKMAARTIRRRTAPVVGAEGGQLDGETERQLHRAMSGGQPL